MPRLPVLLLLLAARLAAAQSLPVISQNPPGLGWREVRAPHFRVLYPAGLDTAARRTTARLEAVYLADGTTLGVQARPVAVVLQNQTTVSNGFVTFLPRHAEFYAAPDQGQGQGTLDALDGLVVHEFRHVNQFDKAREGIGRVVVPLLGDGGLGVNAVGVPQWFFEGDAVGSETALTRSGRGRLPYFGMGLRANLLSGTLYGYQEAVCGSLRDNVPDWYVLGYYLTSDAKVQNGPDVWRRVLSDYYRFPFYPFSFSRAVRRATGLRVEELYARTMQVLDSTWRSDRAARPAPTPVRELAGQPASRIFTQYQYPQYVNDSTVLALRTGLDDIPRLVLLRRRGPARVLYTPGLLNVPEALSVGGGLAVWPEYRQSPRWGARVFSELKILDLRTGRVRCLARGTRYTAAALSPDGRQLVAVHTTAAYRHQLLLLDARSGAVLRVLPNPHNDFYQQPRWLADGQRVAVVALSAAGKALEVIDLTSGAKTTALPAANVNLATPQPWGDYILYNSPQNGVDNIYAVSLKTRQTFQVTNRPFGAFHAAVSPDGRQLALHDYRATGARVVEMPLDPAAWLPLHDMARQDAPAGPFAERLSRGEPSAPAVRSLLASPDSTGPRYALRRYRPLAHALRLLGYGVVQSPDGSSVSLGLRTQDYLSTAQTFAGLSYNQTERTVAATGAVSYQGLPVVLDVEGSYGGRHASLNDGRNVYDGRWQVGRLLAGGRLPLVLTRSRYLQALTLSGYYLHEQVYNYTLPVRLRDATGPDLALNAVQTSLGYALQLRQAARDVAPRAGLTVLTTYRTTPFGTRLQATQWGAQVGAYLPGLARHHSLRLRGGYQYQQQAQYNFAPAISYPRVETTYRSYDRLAVGSVDYQLPLAFMQLPLGRLLYFQRLRADFFADFARGEVQGRDAAQQPVQVVNNFQNYGGDLMLLFNALHLRTPLEAGVRVGYSTLLGRVVVQPLAFSVRL